MQAENKCVVAGDVLFPEGGYQLGAPGQQALSQYVPQLQNLKNAKVVVYGYTDNLPVAPALQRAGIKDNIDLSSKRADNVVAYFRAQASTPTSSRPRALATPIRSRRTTRRMAERRTAASRSSWRAPAPDALDISSRAQHQER
jgi:chemotaxis protein MotB